MFSSWLTWAVLVFSGVFGVLVNAFNSVFQ